MNLCGKGEQREKGQISEDERKKELRLGNKPSREKPLKGGKRGNQVDGKKSGPQGTGTEERSSSIFRELAKVEERRKGEEELPKDKGGRIN